LIALLISAACAEKPARPFFLGLLGPLSRRDARAARWAGLAVAAQVPDGAAAESASDGGATASWGRLRFLAARAAVEGKSGVCFLPPKFPADRAFVDYPEEWQALARVAREMGEMRPVLENGVDEASPAVAAEGVESRAWRLRGRDYVLLVNTARVPVRVDAPGLARFRALFEARADPRDLLSTCAGGTCLPPERVLWLEGRYR
jgi:hypothetical protein